LGIARVSDTGDLERLKCGSSAVIGFAESRRLRWELLME
jgi:hypothetical protein